MKLYIMRHGETDWNTKGWIQGSVDIRLNEKGVMLAEQTRDGLKESGIVFEQIFSSPYVRAKQTAEIIADGTCEIELDYRIREMDFGKYEGISIQEVSENPQYLNMRYFFREPDKYVAREGSESYEEAISRVTRFFEEKIMPLAGQSGNCLVVCHGAIIRVFFAVLCHMELGRLWNLKQPNCGINIFEVTPESVSLEEQAKLFYDASFLPVRKYT